MLGTILNYILIGTFAFFPILIWGYLFSYLDNSGLNAKRFTLGVFAGGVSVFPVLYLEDIVNLVGIPTLNIFHTISNATDSGLWVFLSILSCILIVGTLMLLFGLSFGDGFTSTLRAYGTNLMFLCLFAFAYLALYKLLTSLSIFGYEIPKAQSPGFDITRIGSIILYYIVIGLLEESSKHFGFIPSSLSFSDTVRRGLVYTAFIALGFGFIENILYLVNIHDRQGGYSGIFFSTGFFRAIFSILVHTLCSLVVAKPFLDGFFRRSKELIGMRTYGIIFLKAITLSLLVHAIYDISLTLGFTLIILIYFLFGYLYITKIFYKEESLGSV